MASVQHLRRPESPQRASEHETTVWAMIVILLGLSCFAIASLLSKV